MRVKLERKPPDVIKDVKTTDDFPIPIGPANDFPKGGCRFIFGNVKKAWMCCGHPTHGKTSWCLPHLRIVSESYKNESKAKNGPSP